MFGEIVCKCLPAFAKKNRISQLAKRQPCFWGSFFWGDEPMDWCNPKKNVAQGHRLLEDDLWFHGTLRVGQFVRTQNAIRFTGAPKFAFPGWYGNPMRRSCISHVFLGFPPNSRKKRLYYIQSGKLTWQKSIKCSLKKEHLGRLPSTAIDSAQCFNTSHHVVLNGCGSKSLNPKAMVEILHALVTNMSPPNGPFEKVVPFPKVGYVWICYFPAEPIPGWFLEEWSSRRLVRRVSIFKKSCILTRIFWKLVKQKGEQNMSPVT